MPERYRTIVADPPWELKTGPGWEPGQATRDVPYPTMTVDEVAALPVRGLSDNVGDDAHLYLWTVNSYLRDAFDIARAWGFWPVQTIAWCKAPMGTLGGTWPSNLEFALFCRRPGLKMKDPDALRLTTALGERARALSLTHRQIGDHMGVARMAGWWLSRDPYRCACPTDEQWPRLRGLLQLGPEFDQLVAEINARKGTGERQALRRAETSWFTWPRGEHSQKPDAFQDIVEQVSPGPYLEMFARRRRLGWDAWGNEIDSDLEMAA